MSIERLIEIDDVLSSDVAFAKKVIQIESADEAVKAFEEKGCSFTKEELTEYIKAGKEFLAENNGELPEEALEGVAGGCAKCFFKGMLITGVAIGVVCCGW